MRRVLSLFLLIAVLMSLGMTKAQPWTDLPPLPKALAGQCVGVSSGWLIVAGGSMWSAPPWNGGVKTWSDEVYGLRPGAAAWKLIGRLPFATGYAAAVQHGNDLLCIGGQNATEVFRQVLRLNVSKDGALQLAQLPLLPEPLTNASAAVVHDRLFLLGGQHSTQPQSTAREALQLHLNTGKAWSRLDVPWQHPRILPAVASCGGSVYVGGGADLAVDRDGTPVRQYLIDGWRYDITHSMWSRLPVLPAAVTAAPSACTSRGEWLIFGGDDGALAQQIPRLRDTHPGFRKQVLRFDLVTQRWQPAGELPLSLVTTNAAVWNSHYVLAGGENQPGHRSTRVIQQKLR